MRSYVRGGLLLALLLLAGCGSDRLAESPTAPTATQTQPQPSATSSAGADGQPMASPSMDGAVATPIGTGSTPLPITRAPELPVLYQAEGMERVTTRKDVPYSAERGPNHLLDVYYPAGTEGQAEPLPAVLVVHGSLPASAKAKDQAPFSSWARLIAASEMAAITFNWNHPQEADIGALLTYVRRHSAELGVDPQRLAVLAFSGGAAPALTLALADQSPALRGLVLYYGDLREPARLMTPAMLDQLPPTLVVEAGQDEFVPAEAGEAFLAPAQQLGAPVETVAHPTGAHAFDLRNDDDTTRSIIRRTLEFLKASLS